MSLNYRCLWISDVHLGTAACRAADLLEFLDSVSAGTVYLNGDIIDLLRMGNRIRLPEAHHRVLSGLVERAAAGDDIVYLPGNHDYQLRQYVGRDIFGVRIEYEAVHVTRNDRRLLVTHGDLLDAEVREGTGLESFGAAAYGLLIQLDAAVNRLRSRLGQDYLSISRRIKGRIASANDYIDRFERVAARHARRNRYDGIVCGHIHRPAIRELNGVLYANDGDWVEHRSALAETMSGDIVLLRFDGGAVATERAVLPMSTAA